LKNLIIFDLDGVITSEEAYWDCAGLTLHELLYSPQYWNLLNGAGYTPAATAQTSRTVSRAAFPEWLIVSFKARSLNSNWDTGYATICLHLITLLAQLPRRAELSPLQPCNVAWLAALREQISEADLAQTWDLVRMHKVWQEQHPFDQPVFHGATGLELFERMDAYASQMLGFSVTGIFSRQQPFWRFCQNLFQEWLLGETLYMSTFAYSPAQLDKPGCIFFEEPLLPPDQIRATFEELLASGYTLGMATGRVKQEAAQPLEKYDLWRYFDDQHLATYDIVVWGESELNKHNKQETLGKPHTFHFQAAIDREQALARILGEQVGPLGIPAIAVGDSTSDILSGRAAGALTVAVLTGVRSPESHRLLLKSQPDFIIKDMTKLPVLLEEVVNLGTIQKIQFERRETAEKLLRLWLAKHMDISTQRVLLTPKAVSLNSFNGFYQSQGQEFFFKTHVEEQGVIHEYYHVQLLEKAGYNVVRPLHLLHEKERQMVVYPVVKWPVMFDLMRAEETGQELPAGIHTQTLLEAERLECQQLLNIYANTFQPAQEHAPSSARIHQLFWHRLTGGRYQQFYTGKQIPLPTGDTPKSIAFEQILHAHWRINGVEQPQTLYTLIETGKRVLNPERPLATAIGHGDAHFGNVFLENAGQTQRYLYFDPAFAGQHSPLLDVVKPLFHNIFAMWMYFPYEVTQDLQLVVKLENEYISIEHNYRLTPLRRAMLGVKQEELLTPLLAWLETHQALPADWQDILKLALMCCPLLTVNLFDQEKRPPALGWLGLAQAVQLGNAGLEPWKEE
jgi:phosphoglycolate phosphatase-like HAD superfamily hydrolase